MYSLSLIHISTDPDSLPSFQDFTHFLNLRRQLLENTMPIESGQQFNKPSVKPNNKFEKCSLRNTAGSNTFKSYHAAARHYSCVCCKSDHPLYMCNNFRILSAAERGQLVANHKCCINCLRAGHLITNCKSKQVCKICSKGHHTLLHANYVPKSAAASSNYCSFKLQCKNNVLLSTAVVYVVDQAGNRHKARALLDAGSQINFCTKSFAKRLHLKLTRSNIPITGINNTACCATDIASMRIISRYQRHSFEAKCAVLSNLTHNLPSISFDINRFHIPNKIFLADPDFNISSQIDILLGAQFYLDLILANKYTRGPNFPIIQETKLGYILAGNLPEHCHTQGPAVSFLARNNDSQILQSLERFWEAETIPGDTPDCESACEEHFVRSTQRNHEGRFIVSLPFKSDNPHLGESYTSAESRFLSLERRFRRDAKLARDYADSIREYMDLGHMTLIDHGAINLVASNTCYIYLYILIYLLWLCKLGWDEPISGQSLSDWHSLCNKLVPVSYTHLDVYKRQKYDEAQSEY